MAESKKIQFDFVDVPHPGESVSEYIDYFRWSQRELARRTGLSPKTISEICSGKSAISVTTAMAFEKVFGRPASFWLSLQQQFEEAQARSKEVDNSKKWREWTRSFPLKKMRELELLPSPESGDFTALLSFFGVSSPESWERVWEASRLSYRQTRVAEPNEFAVSAWVRATELEANEQPVSDFDEQALKGALPELRALTRVNASKIMEPVTSICNGVGVAVVWMPEFPKTGISGCARWFGDRALVALSLRYKTDDQMWFTFFHEIGHILLHRKTHSFVIDNVVEGFDDGVVDPVIQKQEDEANRFAADLLIPPLTLEQYIKKGLFDSESIRRFSKELGVSPGIVVGRLQREKILEPYQGNAFKQRLEFGIGTVH